MSPTRRLAVALAAALGLAALFATASRSGYFAALERRLARDEVEAPLDVRNRLRDHLQRQHALHLQPPDDLDQIAPLAADGRCPDPPMGARPVAPGEMPSSRRAPGDWLLPGRTLVSIWLDRCRLKWLHRNRQSRGRRFEELGWVSVYEGGELRFASAVGVRMHGRTSRDRFPYSYRLYFRGTYGAPRFPAALVDPELAGGLRRVIVKRDLGIDEARRPWPLVEFTAQQIARRLGAHAPHARPVKMSLNGTAPRNYYLIEQLSGDFFERELGRADLEVAPGKVSHYEPSAALLRAEERWIAAQPRPLRAAVAATRFDLDSLHASLLTALFVGAGDAFQDALVRDRRGDLAGGRWLLLPWDLDYAFRDLPLRGGLPRRFQGHPDLLPMLLSPTESLPRVPAQLLRRLLREDPGFRAEVGRRLLAALNHDLTPEYLAGLSARLERASDELALDDRDFLVRMADYFERRPRELLRQAELHLGAPAHHAIEVRSDGPRFRVDGRDPVDRLRGWASAATPLRLSLVAAEAGRFDGWYDGERLLSRDPDYELVAAAPRVVRLRARP